MTRRVFIGLAVGLSVAAFAQPASARHAKAPQLVNTLAPLVALFTMAPTTKSARSRTARPVDMGPTDVGSANALAQVEVVAPQVPSRRPPAGATIVLASIAADGGSIAASQSAAPANTSRGALEAAIARHAAMNGVPISLVHRVIMRESRYNPGVVSRGNYGLMQIKPATARGVGYTGSAAGLLDPETNLTYAVRYLAGAYRAAGGNETRAVSYYASGYYRSARR
jgi:soluble lytic murein transglycosylase-like protein